MGRDIERDRRGLDKEEKKLVSLKGSSVLSVVKHSRATSRLFRRILCETSLMKQEPVVVTTNTSNWDSCITRQLGYKHAFSQSIVYTKVAQPYIFFKT